MTTTDQQHPITPPPELVSRWSTSLECPDLPSKKAIYIATQAARWGADQELEACVEWLGGEGGQNGWPAPAALTAARRPKPPSLKAQALAVIENSAICDHLTPEHGAIIRRALESLPD